jgi:phenylacetate-CoA ligase
MSFVIKNYWKYFKRTHYKSYIIQKKIRQLPLDEIKKIQWKRLKDLLNYAYNNIDFYKEYFESVNLNPDSIKTPSDMLRLPLTEKKDYIKNFDKIIAKNIIIKKDYAVATTSGSTGEPFKHYVDIKKEQVNTEMAFILNMESMGIKPFEKNNELTILFRPLNEIIDFKKKPKKKWIRRVIYTFFPESFAIRGYTITKENAPDLVNLIKDNKIKGIYGLASSTLNLAQFIDNKDILKFKYIITMGEGLLDYQRKYISNIFNCPVFMDYGSSECMRMGFECKYQNGFHMDIYNYYFEFLKGNQTFDAADMNKRYDLVVTNLNNYVFPFIRYKIKDAVIPSDNPCLCGNNFPMVKKIFGMDSIIFTAPNGYRLSSGDFAAFFEHYHRHTAAIRQFQVIQKDEKTLLIKIIPTVIYNEKIRKDIENRISDLVEGSMEIEVIPVESIKPERSGKIKMLILKDDADKY